MELILHTVLGLEQVLWKEVRSLDPAARKLGTRQVERRNGLLLVDAQDPETVLRTRIAEDVFALAAHAGDIELGRRGLEQLSQLAAAAPAWDEALRLHAHVTGGRGRRRISTFRVIARMEGDRAYKRRESGEAIASGLRRRLGRNWKLVPDDAQVEVWSTLLGQELLLGVRLTSSAQRHRGKAANIPASLRPSVAAAMVFLSSPYEEDVLLDPFCGAGTILIQRGAVGRHKLLVGSDKSGEALAAAEQNIAGRHQPLELHRWDAAQIPLDDGSVTAIVTNPPFGERIGSHGENQQLYPAFMAEAHRLLRSGGSLVVLTTEDRLMKRLLSADRWLTLGRYRTLVLGRLATIYAARKL